jgi:hypothetical protein
MSASGFQIRKGSGFAVGRVSEIRAACGSQDFKVRNVPKTHRPSYSEVWGVPQNDEPLLVRLGREAWSKVVLCEAEELSED